MKGKVLALLFEKPSLRTRVSFEVAMLQMGGNAIYLSPNEVGLGKREQIPDIARTLSRYVDGIVLRTFAHSNIIGMAKFASIPVINALTDLLHPCQALADVYTIKEKLKNLKKLKLAYIGDGNNVCHSLLYGCSKMGIDLAIATAAGYSPKKEVLNQALKFAKKSKAKISLLNNSSQAARLADIIYTDVWSSMGQEKESSRRKKAFKEFQVNKKLVSFAKAGCLIMHCLPAHRGEEITDDVIDSKNSIIFDQAENRLHVQKAILIKLLN